MPTAPEFGGAQSLVRAVEVLGQAETHQECNANGDVGITREVGVNLQRVGKQCNQVFKAGKQQGSIENAVHEVGGQVVTQDNLLGEAVQNPEYGDSEGAAGQEILAVKLRHEFIGAHNGACHQLREERKVEAEIQDVVDGLDFTAVDVDAVAHGLEGEERNTDRQDNGVYQRMGAEHLVACGSKEVVHVQLDTGKVVEGVQEEVRVLIVAQNKQVDDDHDDHPSFLFPLFFGLFNPLADKEVRYHTENKDANVASACLVVEEHAGRKQEGVAKQDAVLDQGECRKYKGKKSPEIELRKQQRTIRVKCKGSSEERNDVVEHYLSFLFSAGRFAMCS